MPLFEYACKSCDHQFEALVRGSETPSCPACHGTELQRRLSVFAAHTNGISGGKALKDFAPAGPCGTCGNPNGPGACSLN